MRLKITHEIDTRIAPGLQTYLGVCVCARARTRVCACVFDCVDKCADVGKG